MSSKMMQKIADLFKSLRQPVFLLDKTGRCLIPQQPDTFLLPESLKENVLVSKSGYLFYTLPGFMTHTLATKDRPEAGDILLLCVKLIATFQQEEGITGEVTNALKRLVNRELSELEMDALANEHGIPFHHARCALLIRFQRPYQQFTQDSTLSDFIPQSPGDLAVPIDNYNLLLLCSLTETNREDMGEYALALLDSIQMELGLQAHIGIGESVSNLTDTALSFHQAWQAIQIGSVFCPEVLVYDYQSLLLERFVMDCLPQQSRQYIDLLFNRKTAKLFNEEMLETVRVFFKNDLNLTDAARELYIHRNTLVYRLDKIQKVSGLDLRHFRDAMLFKLFNDLRIRETISGSKESSKH